jgi:hypothetical protein
MTPALQTHGLQKSFGALRVAQDISKPARATR